MIREPHHRTGEESPITTPHDHDHDSVVPDDAMAAHVAWLENTDGTRTGRMSRRLAERTSRRGLFARLGKLAVGAAGLSVLPALPVLRANASTNAPAARRSSPTQGADDDPMIDFTGTDPTDCNYWRYCNMGGRICATCEGGGITTCPPGTVLGVEYWVGCCTDPESGRTYLTANYDCCGKSGCGERCGEPWQQDTPTDVAPGSLDRNVLWCMSDPTQSYACTVVPIIGEDCQARPAARSRAQMAEMAGQSDDG